MIHDFVSQYTNPIYDFIKSNWIYAIFIASLIIILYIFSWMISSILGRVNEGKTARKSTFAFISEEEIIKLISEKDTK